MSTTWNSRVESRALLAWLLAMAASCAASQGAAEVAPDSPLPRPRAEVVGVGTQAPSDTQTVELQSVRLRLVKGDSMLSRLAGPVVLGAQAPVAIDVITAQPLGNVQRTASPEIFIDGAPVGDTWPLPPNRLVAFVRDQQRLRVGAAITVAWLGNEARTRTRRPLVLTPEHLRAIQ